MRTPKSIERLALVLACVGMLIPRQALLADQPIQQNNIADVALDAGGIFHGRVVDAQGQPVAMANVRMARDGAAIVSTVSNDEGGFDVASLQGGVYQLQVGTQSQSLRLWAANTAPPQAHQGFTFTSGTVARGQGCTMDSCTGTCGGTCAACGGGALGFLTNPWVIGAAVAAAIAIPLALNDDDDDNAS